MMKRVNSLRKRSGCLFKMKQRLSFAAACLLLVFSASGCAERASSGGQVPQCRLIGSWRSDASLDPSFGERMSKMGVDPAKLQSSTEGFPALSLTFCADGRYCVDFEVVNHTMHEEARWSLLADTAERSIVQLSNTKGDPEELTVTWLAADVIRTDGSRSTSYLRRVK